MKKGCYLLMVLLSSLSGYSQQRVSLDSISGFECFDSISEIGVWRTHETYFLDSSLKEEFRFRIWGDGCSYLVNGLTGNKKCFYKYQRQSFFKGKKIQEKQGAYGWVSKNDSKKIHHLMVYNEKGKLLFVEKKINK